MLFPVLSALEQRLTLYVMLYDQPVLALIEKPIVIHENTKQNK